MKDKRQNNYYRNSNIQSENNASPIIRDVKSRAQGNNAGINDTFDANAEIIDNRYRIIRELARGGMGAVYLVNDIRLHKDWAAKIVVGLEDNELLALKKVSHPLFPRIVDSIATDVGVWIIMDYFEASSLKEAVKDMSITIDRIYDIAISLAEALNYLHTLPLPMLYMDCKPSNVLITKDGNIRLIDLGSVYIPNAPNPGRVSGTPGYASPEQRKNLHIDARSDIYSFGKTMEFILRNVNLKKSHDYRELKEIIKKCTAFYPGDRYSSMINVIGHLKSRSSGVQSAVINTVKQFLWFFYKFTLALFTIIAFKTYSEVGEIEFMLMGIALLVLLIINCRRQLNSSMDELMCIEDVHLTMGSRLLMIEFIFLLPLFALQSDYCLASEDASDNGMARIEIVESGISGSLTSVNATDLPRVTVINSLGHQVLYKGQTVTVDSDNNVTVHIPKDSIDENNPPVQAFINE